MPTSSDPAISVHLDPADHRRARIAAAVRGTSMASLARDLLMAEVERIEAGGATAYDEPLPGLSK